MKNPASKPDHTMKKTLPLIYKILTVLLFSLFIDASFAQSPAIEWQKCYGGSDNEMGEASIRQTNNGGYLLCGRAYSNDGNVYGNHGGGDHWIIKLNSAFDTLWTRCYGGSLTEMHTGGIQTNDGGYIIGGTTASDDGDVSGFNGTQDVWVLKLDENGDTIWTRCYGGSNEDHGISLQITDDGGYLIAGYAASDDGDVTNNIGGGDAWLVKIDSTGDTLWTKCFGGTSVDVAFYAHQTTDKGYIMAGATYSNDFYVSGWHGSFDAWVVKLDSLLDTVWTNCLGGTGWEQARCIRETSDGGFILAGYTDSDDGDVHGNHGKNDIWIIKLNADGDTLWTRCLGGSENDESYYVIETADHEYVVAGYSASDNGDVTGSHGSTEAWLVKLKQDGGVRWAKCLGGNAEDKAYQVIQIPDEGYAAVGETSSHDGDISTNHGAADLWFLKLSADPAGEKPVVADDNMIIVYPNPVNKLLYIEFPGEKYDNAVIEIKSVNGRLVYLNEMNEIAGRINAEIDVSSMPEGLYLLTIKNNRILITRKIEITR
jgi:hypothetical protein